MRVLPALIRFVAAFTAPLLKDISPQPPRAKVKKHMSQGIAKQYIEKTTGIALQ